MRYEISKEEKEYLKNYRISDYERPSIAADIVTFSVAKEKETDIRRSQKSKLQVLLIKRESYPYKNYWALPGGFCRKDEDVYKTAQRELYEETNIKDAYMQVSGIYGEPDRDPRGWIISNAFLALIDGSQVVLRAGTDAWDAKWFDVDIKKEELERYSDVNSISITIKYDISLKNEDIALKGTVIKHKLYKNHHTVEECEITENNGIAFDHAMIIIQAFENLQEKAEHDEKIIFNLMSAKFTLPELQDVFEAILKKTLLKANFRRKIADYVIETDEQEPTRGYRSAAYYKRNEEKFY